jgi:fused signal recognition particle receptor
MAKVRNKKQRISHLHRILAKQQYVIIRKSEIAGICPMFNLLKKRTGKTGTLGEQTEKDCLPEKVPEKTGVLAKIRTSLAKTRAHFSESFARLLSGKKELDASLIEQIETLLLTSDVGIRATQRLTDNLTKKLARKELANPEAVLAALKSEMTAILIPCEQPLVMPDTCRPFVILMVGVNGAGKTTTIGKLAHYFQAAGKKIMLAAGDTFRAAAIEQLQAWGNRNNIPVIAQSQGTDTAAVIHDAMTAARSRGIDILIADTAGRLHTQGHLMEELKKVKRVLARIDPAAPHETLLVLDAGNGQNALNQATQFHAAIGVTGLALTKLDGTAKGGIIFAIAETLKLPVRFIGTGEDLNDLKPFAAEHFVDALFED